MAAERASPSPAAEGRTAAGVATRPAPASWGLLLAGLVAVVTGLLATLPLAFTALGVLEVVALLRNDWDPTWNDGDLGFSAVGLGALLVLLAVAWACGGAIARRAGLPGRAVGAATALLALVVALVAASITGLLGT